MSDFVSHSSSVGRLWVHLRFKVKYCHKIFRFPEIKARCEQLLWEATARLNVRCSEIGIDEDHAHLVVDIALEPLHKIAKSLKGYTAKRMLREYPWLKKQYFWKSGMWNPAYYFDSLGTDLEKMNQYVRRQGEQKAQSGLVTFFN